MLHNYAEKTALKQHPNFTSTNLFYACYRSSTSVSKTTRPAPNCGVSAYNMQLKNAFYSINQAPSIAFLFEKATACQIQHLPAPLSKTSSKPLVQTLAYQHLANHNEQIHSRPNLRNPASSCIPIKQKPEYKFRGILPLLNRVLELRHQHQGWCLPNCFPF